MLDKMLVIFAQHGSLKTPLDSATLLRRLFEESAKKHRQSVYVFCTHAFGNSRHERDLHW